MTFLTICLAVFVIGQLLVWGVTAWVSVENRKSGRGASAGPGLTEPISLVVLTSGLNTLEAQDALSALAINDDNFEIIFVAEHADEIASRTLKAALKSSSIAVPVSFVYGREGRSHNPKLDSMRVGMQAAKHDVIALLDGNVYVPVDFLQHIRSAWVMPNSVVTTLPDAQNLSGFWSGVEAVWINNVYWRWVRTGWVLGVPACIGKLLVFRRSWLDAHGGVTQLGRCAAEDGALAELATMTNTPIQPINSAASLRLYDRSLAAVLARALRWAMVRCEDRKGVYASEILNTLFSALALSAFWAFLAEQVWWPIGLSIVAYWHLLEAGMSLAQHRWSPGTHIAILVRDLLTVPVWLAGWVMGSYRWRGYEIKIS